MVQDSGLQAMALSLGCDVWGLWYRVSGSVLRGLGALLRVYGWQVGVYGLGWHLELNGSSTIVPAHMKLGPIGKIERSWHFESDQLAQCEQLAAWRGVAWVRSICCCFVQNKNQTKNMSNKSNNSSISELHKKTTKPHDTTQTQASTSANLPLQIAIRTQCCSRRLWDCQTSQDRPDLDFEPVDESFSLFTHSAIPI